MELIIEKLVKELCQAISVLSAEDKIKVLNHVKTELHKISPMAGEPVDCVLWVPAKEVLANDYNPNKVAPPEMKLLELSIREDGFTQPIVTFSENNAFTVIDGFHRHLVGQKSKIVKERVKGYLPITVANESRGDRGDRIAATIRHNRARGKHQVQAMSELVVELSRRNWTEEKIARELGMDADEVLRLKQISGLSEMFMDREFSEAWEAGEEGNPLADSHS